MGEADDAVVAFARLGDIQGAVTGYLTPRNHAKWKMAFLFGGIPRLRISCDQPFAWSDYFLKGMIVTDNGGTRWTVVAVDDGGVDLIA